MPKLHGLSLLSSSTAKGTKLRSKSCFIIEYLKLSAELVIFFAGACP